jgi:hypothetical protein
MTDQLKKFVYLCGGINGLSDSECNDWRAFAKEHLVCETIDPMRRDYRGIEDQSVGEIVAGDTEDITNCDYLLVNASRPSWGTAMEIRMGYAEMDKQVVLVVDRQQRVSPWLRYHSQHPIFVDFHTAILYINGILKHG